MNNDIRRYVKKGDLLVTIFNGKQPNVDITDYISILGVVNEKNLKIGQHINYKSPKRRRNI